MTQIASVSRGTDEKHLVGDQMFIWLLQQGAFLCVPCQVGATSHVEKKNANARRRKRMQMQDAKQSGLFSSRAWQYFAGRDWLSKAVCVCVFPDTCFQVAETSAGSQLDLDLWFRQHIVVAWEVVKFDKEGLDTAKTLGGTHYIVRRSSHGEHTVVQFACVSTLCTTYVTLDQRRILVVQLDGLLPCVQIGGMGVLGDTITAHNVRVYAPSVNCRLITTLHRNDICEPCVDISNSPINSHGEGLSVSMSFPHASSLRSSRSIVESNVLFLHLVQYGSSIDDVFGSGSFAHICAVTLGVSNSYTTRSVCVSRTPTELPSLRVKPLKILAKMALQKEIPSLRC